MISSLLAQHCVMHPLAAIRVLAYTDFFGDTCSITVRIITKTYNKHRNHPYLITSLYVMDISS